MNITFEKYNKDQHKEDIDFISNNLSYDNLKEVFFHSCAVKISCEYSLEAYIAKYKGIPLCAFGVGVSGGEYIIWCLVTKDMKKHNKKLIFYSKKIAISFTEKYGTLCNFVPVFFKDAEAWLKHIGFTPGEEKDGLRRWTITNG